MEEKELLGKYCLVLGLEIHLHLNTQKKMFCRCSADVWEKEPNSVICPVCLGLPGTLPVPNLEATQKTQLLGLALGCSLNNHSRFDRKHYFYPDLPKGYQISQYKQPFCINGKLELDSGNIAFIERVHLEEDVAKSFHEGEKTLVDFNKSGVPLVEVVTTPCFRNISDAVDYCKQIQLIVRCLGIGEVNMEKGQMRLEANISLRTKEMEEKNELPSYKVEVKNINSFKFMEKAVKMEIVRQREILKSGNTPTQENRGFKEGEKDTVSQRSKEEAKDYRYFPEPDIPPIEFDNKYLEDIRKKLPELPHQTKKYLIEKYNLPKNIAKVLVENLGLSYVRKFKELVEKGLDAGKTANLLINRLELRDLEASEILSKLNEKSSEKDKEISSVDLEKLEEVVLKVLGQNNKAVEDYKKGKEASLQFLIGMVMREAGVRLDPLTVKKILIEKIELQ
jgi:aspartyl-tRNA(Asn)/glutamyl-tRNA(Gln) amidotransferase subunit B